MGHPRAMAIAFTEPAALSREAVLGALLTLALVLVWVGAVELTLTMARRPGLPRGRSGPLASDGVGHLPKPFASGRARCGKSPRPRPRAGRGRRLDGLPDRTRSHPDNRGATEHGD